MKVQLENQEPYSSLGFCCDQVEDLSEKEDSIPN